VRGEIIGAEQQPAGPLTKAEAHELQEMVARVWSSGSVMLMMTNSQQSYFFAEAKLLSAVYKKLHGRDSFVAFVKQFLLIFAIKMKREGIELELDVTNDFPENVFIEK